MNVKLPQKNRGKTSVVRLCFIFCGYVLYKTFGFDDDKLAEFGEEINRFFAAEFFNKTLADEAVAWAQKHNFLQEGW
jgi:hypothetical protein